MQNSLTVYTISRNEPQLANEPFMADDNSSLPDYRRIAYQRYSYADPCDYRAFRDYYRRKLNGHLAIPQDWHCLDLACGFGNFLAYLRDVGIHAYTGIDTSAEATTAVRQEFGDDSVVLTDAFEFLASDGDEYDLISALDFLEHVSKSDLFRLLFMANARQPVGGMLLIRTPNANGLFGSAARYGDITHEICFTPASLSDVLSRCGYIVQSAWEDGPALGSILQILHWLTWQIVRCGIRLVNASETGSWGDGILTRNMWILAKKSSDASIEVS